LVGWKMGISPGFAPSSILSIKSAMRTPNIGSVDPVCHKPSDFNELTIGIDRRQTTLRRKLDDQSSMSNVFVFVRYDEAIGTLLRKGCKYPLVLLRNRPRAQ
jgi:hypothetical protein